MGVNLRSLHRAKYGVATDRRALARIKAQLTGQKTTDPIGHFVHRVPGGLQTVLDVLRFSADDRVIAVLTDPQVNVRQPRRFIQACYQADLTPVDLMTEFSKIAIRLGHDQAEAIRGLSLPDLMTASIARATGKNIVAHREARMHFEHLGLTTAPRPGGTRVGVQVNTGSGASPPPVPLGHTGLPPLLESQRELAADIRADQEAQAREHLPTEAEVDAEDGDDDDL